MKNNVKRFGDFVNERFGEDSHIGHDNMRGSSNGIPMVATVALSTSMSGEFGTIFFNGEEKSVEEKESLRATWQNILDVANSMGADLIYSTEDDSIISQEDIDSLDDQPSGWVD